MKIVLLKNVNSIGRLGEVKEVSDGFALNYLLPRQLAAKATGQAIAKVSQKKQQIDKGKVAPTVNSKDLVNRLKNFTLAINGKTDDKGTFFAGFTKDKLLKLLSASGFNFKSKQLRLDEPIKKVGNYTIVISLTPELQISVKVRADKL